MSVTVNTLLRELMNLDEQGYGGTKIFAIHNTSGAADEIWSLYPSTHVGEAGPFDLEDDEEYIALTIGGN